MNFGREIIQQEMKKLEAELEKLENQPDSPVKSSLQEKTRTKLMGSELKLQQLENDLADIGTKPGEKAGGRLECGIAYPGTEISFGEEMLRIRQVSGNALSSRSTGRSY